MIILILPVFNEELNIEKTVKQTEKALAGKEHMFIAINDGSSDGSLEILERLATCINLNIISFVTNQGIGEVFRVAFEKALRNANDDDIIITKEADGTSDLSILNEMIGIIDSGNDVCFASCYHNSGMVKNVALHRCFISKIANSIIKVLYREKNLATFSSFYRCHRAGFLKKAMNRYDGRLIESDGFECMLEMYIKFRKMNAKIGEVPMILNWESREGPSKMRMIKTFLGYLKIFFKY